MATQKSTVALEVTTKGLTEAGQSVGSFKKQLREANNELVTMSEKFGLASKEAQDAAKKVAGLKDAIGDAKALAETFNPDKKFVALGGALQGAVGGFTALQGAMGLFGGQGKEVEALLLKVNSAMALQQGISGIASALDSFKLLKTELIGGVSKAFGTLKGAIISTGIGALVVALGLLVANFDDVKKAVLNFIPGLASVGKWFGKLYDSVTDFIGVTSEATRAMDKMIETADRSLATNKKFLQEHGDEIDAYTKRKIDAKNSYLEAIKEDGADQVALAKRLNRELDAADSDRSKAAEEARQKERDKIQAENEKDEAKRKQDAEKKKAAEEKIIEDARKQRLTDLENAKAQIKDQQEQNEKDAFKKSGVVAIQAVQNIALIDATITTEDQMNLIRKKAREEDQKDAEIMNQAKIQATVDTLNIITDVVGRQTVAGKAMAVASALISTYQGIAAGVKLGFPAAIPAVLAATVTGFAAVKNILKTKVPGKVDSGGSIPSITAPIAPQAETTKLDQGSINKIGNAASRAYVLESDVTGQQDKIARLNRAARIN